MVKGVNVLLARDVDGYVLFSRNMLPGTVKQIKKGENMASVSVELDNGDSLTSVCTVDSAEHAGIAEDVRVQAVIKAPHVILAVKQYVLAEAFGSGCFMALFSQIKRLGLFVFGHDRGIEKGFCGDWLLKSVFRRELVFYMKITFEIRWN